MVTTETLLKIAGLAKISLEGEDLDALVADFESIIAFADAVNSADLSAMDITEHDEPYPLREDILVPSAPNEKVLQNAPAAHDGFFVAKD